MTDHRDDRKNWRFARFTYIANENNVRKYLLFDLRESSSLRLARDRQSEAMTSYSWFHLDHWIYCSFENSTSLMYQRAFESRFWRNDREARQDSRDTREDDVKEEIEKEEEKNENEKKKKKEKRERKKIDDDSISNDSFEASSSSNDHSFWLSENEKKNENDDV